jgi:hypothetical protein
MLRLLSVTAVLLLSGCAAAPPTPPPADFALQLDFREGSVPPPDYFEYQIVLQADGNGSYHFRPDYPSADTPLWERRFTYDPAALYLALSDGGLLTTRWQQPAQPPIGGAQHWLVLRADGQVFELPPQLIEAQQPTAAALLAAVEATVPVHLRDEVAALHQAYTAGR